MRNLKWGILKFWKMPSHNILTVDSLSVNPLNYLFKDVEIALRRWTKEI